MPETSALVRNYKTYIPTMLIAAGILYLSLASGDALPKSTIHFENADKLVHCAMYFTLTAAFAWDMRRSGVAGIRSLVLAATLPIVYGGAIELIQPYFPPRTAEWADLLADATGAWLATILFDMIWKKTHC